MPVEVVNRDRSEPFLAKDRSEIRSILDRTNSTATNQSLAEAILPPGAETEEHLHPRTEEIYYVLRGRGLMSLEGERREVGPGDGILIPTGTRHTRTPSSWTESVRRFGSSVVRSFSRNGYNRTTEPSNARTLLERTATSVGTA